MRSTNPENSKCEMKTWERIVVTFGLTSIIGITLAFTILTILTIVRE